MAPSEPGRQIKMSFHLVLLLVELQHGMDISILLKETELRVHSILLSPARKLPECWICLVLPVPQFLILAEEISAVPAVQFLPEICTRKIIWKSPAMPRFGA